ncbi:MAG: hypothetical protein HYV35_05905 [Lentisphaerae bacterium]|nr:hypothetical protein [Lentisphaerota bacterium]
MNVRARINRSVVIGLLGSSLALATPSTTYWTPAVTDIQPFGVLHLGVDNYTTVFRKADRGGGDFATDYGLTMGVLPFEKLQLEVGVDLFEPSDYPLAFNAKLGTPEGTLFTESPALNVGIFNVGTKRDVTDYDTGYVVIGKTIPLLGRVFAGGYLGSDTLVDAEGDKDNKGFMVGMDHGFCPVKDRAGDEYNRLVLAGDWASGDNFLGGGGAGLYYYFTRNISLLTGPVFFNDSEMNGKWKWTVQLDINAPVFGQ